MNTKFFFITLLMSMMTTTLFAKDEMASETHMKMSKEDRSKMADMHMKMADCLKSDKEMSECKKVWMDSCKEMGDKCTMMGKSHQMGSQHTKK